MTWIPLLLADPSPSLRWLVLRQILALPEDDPEVQELSTMRESDPLVVTLLRQQEVDGSWRGSTSSGGAATGGLFAYGAAGDSPLRSTALALARLGYLGLDHTHPAVSRAAEWLFSQQGADGGWPLGNADAEEPEQPRKARDGYSMVPLQTALPLRGLAACGYAQDPRAERAYAWLLERRLSDGAWPTGIAGGGVYGYVAGYRRLAHSRWGCRSNTTGALLCLSLHPQHSRGPEARQALDLLLGRETRERHAMGFEVARLLGAEPARGFLTTFARFDLALVLDLCARCGMSPEDARLASLVEFILAAQGEFGLWEYPAQPQVSRWVTFDLLRSLTRIDRDGEWIGLEPRTPFQPYPRRQKRY